QLGLARMHQKRLHAGLLDLTDDPVPVARRLHRYRSAPPALPQIVSDGSGNMLQAAVPHSTRNGLPLHPTVTLVTVKRDILLHARLLPREVSRLPAYAGN